MSKRRLTEQQRRRISRNQTQHLDLEGCHDGIIVRHFGREVIVEDAAGALHECKLRQNLGEIACGDRVSFLPQQDTEHGVVVAMQARENMLERIGFGGRPKSVAANLDQVLIVCAIRPEPNHYLIDRYIVATRNLPATPVLVINKTDLDSDDGDAVATKLHNIYGQIDLEIIRTSTKTGEGIDALRQQLAAHTSIFVGLSGVGKSSLVNCILPEVDARVGDISAASQEGTHTTTVSSLYRIPTGGYLIDSPGVRDFSPVITTREQVLRGFSELHRHLGECKFNDCSHTNEPGCAIQATIGSGEIIEQRLKSYQHMLEEIVTGESG